MKVNDDILMQHLHEQIALEEHLCKIIQEQVTEVVEPDFADAKSLLKKISVVLERHFTPLNELLKKLEDDALMARKKAVANNGSDNGRLPDPSLKNRRMSKILRDNYSALNLITISNTLLHTTALALNCHEVAAIALKHLENLAPLVIEIGELMPEVAARELRVEAPRIELSIAQTALKNTQLAWRRAS